MNISPMTQEDAHTISTWLYEEPFSIYNFDMNSETICELLNGDYYVALDESNLVYGYFCFGKSAQIPTCTSNIYNDEFLDIGLGMNPDLCGKGLGLDFLKVGLNFAHERFRVEKYRLTVAVFNQRAIRVYKKCGFHCCDTIKHKTSHNDFYIMKYEE